MRLVIFVLDFFEVKRCGISMLCHTSKRFEKNSVSFLLGLSVNVVYELYSECFHINKCQKVIQFDKLST